MEQTYMGNKINQLRKEKNLTQEQLADQLGISYQAVSKWENNIAFPDIMLLPRLAEIFNITIDGLFGDVELDVAVTDRQSEGCTGNQNLPWEDDKTLHIVLYKGHELLKEVDPSMKRIEVEITGEALNVHSYFGVECESVRGNVEAGGPVECEDVGGNVISSASVSCSDIHGNLKAGDSVEASDVSGELSAGGNVSCGDVHGNVAAGGHVEAGDVEGGNVSAQGNVSCGDVGQNVSAKGQIVCGEVSGDAASSSGVIIG